MSKSFKLFLTCLILALTFSQAWAYPGNAAPAGSGAAVPATAGTVVETMNAAGYTYALLETDDGKKWTAMPETELKVGQAIEIDPGVPMYDFSSKSLNRTFDTNYFSKGIVKR